MERNWYAFFSMFFWWCTKVLGLGLFVTGLLAIGVQIGNRFDFWILVTTGLLPASLGFLLIRTEVVFDLATNEQERRTRKDK